VIDYRSQGRLPAKPHTAFENGTGGLYYEQCITQDGFEGPFSMLYHQRPPQAFHSGRHIPALWPQPQDGPAEGSTPLRRRHFRSQDASPFGSPCTGRIPLLYNSDITVGALKPVQGDDFTFCNGDGDDLFYIHRGGGTLVSWFGELNFSEGDFVVVPRGILHRFELKAGLEQHWFWVESSTTIEPPEGYRNGIGQLRMDAPYTHRDFMAPRLTDSRQSTGHTRRITKRRGQFTEHMQSHNPMDVVGWDGTIYPYVFPMARFTPKTGQIHLPPTAHATFKTQHALICSFVPRMVDYGEKAVTCPYPHSNVDIEEVIFYADGAFTSRNDTGAGSVSFHPSGVPHGPHPGTYEASVGVRQVQERAVMLDIKGLLYISPHARDVEVRDYDESWHRPTGDDT
jgi:homogentisate 1,2-dioxygenase